jgi:hypothetical protein
MASPKKPPVALLMTSITFFLYALTQWKDVRKAYSVSDSDYNYNMTIFIISLGVSLFLAGTYFGIWWAYSKNTKSSPPGKR